MKINKVMCSKCKTKKLVNPLALEQRIKRFGSIEEIELNWTCRNCNQTEAKKVEAYLEGDEAVL